MLPPKLEEGHHFVVPLLRHCPIGILHLIEIAFFCDGAAVHILSPCLFLGYVFSCCDGLGIALAVEDVRAHRAVRDINQGCEEIPASLRFARDILLKDENQHDAERDSHCDSSQQMSHSCP